MIDPSKPIRFRGSKVPATVVATDLLLNHERVGILVRWHEHSISEQVCVFHPNRFEVTFENVPEVRVLAVLNINEDGVSKWATREQADYAADQRKAVVTIIEEGDELQTVIERA